MSGRYTGLFASLLAVPLLLLTSAANAGGTISASCTLRATSLRRTSSPHNMLCSLGGRTQRQGGRRRARSTSKSMTGEQSKQAGQMAKG